MTCQNAREVFPELLDSRSRVADDVESRDARAHLAGCPACQQEFAALTRTVRALDALPTPERSPRLRKNFYAMLEAEKHATTRTHSAPERAGSRRSGPRWTILTWILSPLAGCALVAVGFIAGRNSNSAQSEPISAPSNVAMQADTTQRELVALREQINQQRQQLDKMTTLVGYSILQQQQSPANERLKDVLAAARSENVNDRILDDLIQALTLDPSANVRLRAIEALYPHAERATVRAGVLAALPREQNPLVQLELIDFVASAQERSATPLLEQISADETTNRTVRDAARLALAQL